MPTRVIVALVALALAATTGGPAHAASISNVYFTTWRACTSSCATCRRTPSGELEGPGGKVVRTLNWNEQSFNRAATWRFVTSSFNLKNLEPGEYSIDLTVDDAPAGTYGFTLK